MVSKKGSHADAPRAPCRNSSGSAEDDGLPRMMRILQPATVSKLSRYGKGNLPAGITVNATAKRSQVVGSTVDLRY
jgi:hypothetical protein